MEVSRFCRARVGDARLSFRAKAMILAALATAAPFA